MSISRPARDFEMVKMTVPGPPADDLALELSYDSNKMRIAAMDEKVARKTLGEELARSFHSLVADMRDAMFLGEVPDNPEPIHSGGKIRLNYSLGKSVVLEAEPIGPGVIDASNWGDVHRVKLVRIHDNGVVVI